MKQWLFLAGFALAGTLVGVMAKIVVANHTAAAQPSTTTSTTGS